MGLESEEGLWGKVVDSRERGNGPTPLPAELSHGKEERREGHRPWRPQGRPRPAPQGWWLLWPALSPELEVSFLHG